MTLYELANQTTIQGDIRVSAFYDDGEHVLISAKGVDDLAYEIPEAYEDMTVRFIFGGEDGIHIEVSVEE